MIGHYVKMPFVASSISVNCGGDRRDLLDKEIKVAVDAIIRTASLDN